jgi:hypothetical protein
LTAVLLAAGIAAAGTAQGTTFAAKVRHEAVVADIPAGAAKARVWLALPRDDFVQRVEELRLSAGGRESAAGSYENRVAYWEVANPGPSLIVTATYALERRVVKKVEDAVSAARSSEPINERSRRFYAADLAAASGIPTGARIAALARQVLGGEQNPVLQAKKVWDWLMANAERVAPGAHPAGDAAAVMAQKRGGDADLALLFVALARAGGLPARPVDGLLFAGGSPPRAHTWAEFFALGIGWLPVDPGMAKRESDPGLRDGWFGNLDARRAAVATGRDLTLDPRQATGVRALALVHVEVDGQAHPASARVVAD